MTTHAKVYKSKVSNGDGAYYEYEVQVNRDGEGQSFQHHQQVQQKQVGTLEPGGSGGQVLEQPKKCVFHKRTIKGWVSCS